MLLFLYLSPNLYWSMSFTLVATVLTGFSDDDDEFDSVGDNLTSKKEDSQYDTWSLITVATGYGDRCSHQKVSFE